MLSREVRSYVPRLYDGYVEMEELARVEDNVMNWVDTEIKNARDNQFALTATLDGLAEYERMLGIVYNPATETVEFRRGRIINRLSMTPPFTYNFLKLKLNEIIGVGNWAATVDYANRVLYIEASASNQVWLHEVHITINKIKPCNMIFVNKPRVNTPVKVSEEIRGKTKIYNYRLGSWVLGQLPIASNQDMGVFKLASTSSVKPAYLQDIAAFCLQDITSVLINDTHTITSFVTKETLGASAIVEYDILGSLTNEVTNIKLLGAGGKVLTESTVYIPVIDSVTCKHTIPVKEEA